MEEEEEEEDVGVRRYSGKVLFLSHFNQGWDVSVTLKQRKQMKKMPSGVVHWYRGFVEAFCLSV
jgi:hypothetical protein